MRALFLSLILSLLLLPAPTPARAQSRCSPAVLGLVHLGEETTGFIVDADYPVPCAPAAARLLRDHVAEGVRAFKETDPGHDLRLFPHRYEMFVRQQTWSVAHGRLLSVRLHTMVYTGGAHPNNWPGTWLFDMADGSALTMDDVFAAPRAALRALAPRVRAELRAALGQMALDDMLLPGSEPTPENYANFTMDDASLTFCFAPYQVGPYAAGEQQVRLPLADLREWLAPSFIERLE